MMKMTFRWYGEKDSIPLNYIKQIQGMDGVVTAEISKCVRDADFDGVSAKTGDYIGFEGKTLLASSSSRKEAVKLTVEKLNLDNH